MKKMNLSQVRNSLLWPCWFMENDMTGERIIIRSIAGCSVAPFWSQEEKLLQSYGNPRTPCSWEHKAAWYIHSELDWDQETQVWEPTNLTTICFGIIQFLWLRNEALGAENLYGSFQLWYTMVLWLKISHLSWPCCFFQWTSSPG